MENVGLSFDSYSLWSGNLITCGSGRAGLLLSLKKGCSVTKKKKEGLLRDCN